jgi:YVTN family beta-propeller protein
MLLLGTLIFFPIAPPVKADSVIATIPVGSTPHGVAYDSANGMVYVVNGGSNSASVIDDSTNRVVSNVTVGCRPLGVAFDSSNKLVYVTSMEMCPGTPSLMGSVSIIDASVNNVIKR